MPRLRLPDAEASGPPPRRPVPPPVPSHFARTGEAAVLNGRAPLGMWVLGRGGAEIRVEMSLAPLEPQLAASADDPVRHILLMFRDASPATRADSPGLEAARAEPARAET